jgi:hypothetical protein
MSNQLGFKDFKEQRHGGTLVLSLGVGVSLNFCANLGILVDLIVSIGNDVCNQFSVEIHHDGFFCGIGSNRCYVDGKID